MIVSAWIPWAILAAIAAQRISELVLARRNTTALLARGATEAGAGHYPFIVAVHTLWLAALVVWVARTPSPIVAPWLAAYVALQLLRAWVLMSLGPYWTTRVITLADAPLVRRGPYRFVRHPNYVVVIAEIAVLPLVFGAWPIALVFSILNAVVLAVRLRVENAVLTRRPTH